MSTENRLLSLMQLEVNVPSLDRTLWFRPWTQSPKTPPWGRENLRLLGYPSNFTLPRTCIQYIISPCTSRYARPQAEVLRSISTLAETAMRDGGWRPLQELTDVVANLPMAGRGLQEG